jgi:hypothetical protein
VAKREFALCRRYILGEFKTTKVRVMARSEGYAMVRHKGCVPFVVAEDQLEPLERGTAQEEARHV